MKKQKDILPEDEPLKPINFEMLDEKTKTQEATEVEKKIKKEREQLNLFTLSEKFKPNNCIHCGSVSLSGTSIELMTAQKWDLGVANNYRKISYSYFLPLTVVICDKCIRTEGAKINKKRNLRLFGFLGGSVIAWTAIGLYFLLPRQSDSTGLECLGWSVIIFGLFGLYLAIEFFRVLFKSVKNRAINPEVDSIERTHLLFDEYDGLLKYFVKDVVKTVQAAREIENLVYWSMDDYNKNIKPGMSNQ
jgi:hypothetical protein